MRLIKTLIAMLLCVCIAAAALLGMILVRGYRLAGIAETVAQNHLVEKGNPAAWPVKLTGLLGEITKTSDSVRISAETVKTLLADEGAKTAKSLQTSAASLSKVSDKISTLTEREGSDTAKSVRDAAAGLAGTSQTVQSILANDAPATAKSVRDAAAGLAGIAKTLNSEVPATAKSIREAADTAQQVIAVEGPPTAAAIRKTTESASDFTDSWAKISKALDSWVERLTAPPTVKQQIIAFLRLVIIGLSHLL